MKRKVIAYSLMSAAGLMGLMGAHIASAHGFFGGWSTLSPDEIATKQQAMFQNQAQILGISVDDVKNAWASGKTMQQIIQEKGLDVNQIQARVKDMHLQQMKSQLQTLVDRGIITQAQADARVSAITNRIQNGTTMGKGMLRRGFLF